jgi:hypothetical protein
MATTEERAAERTVTARRAQGRQVLPRRGANHSIVMDLEASTVRFIDTVHLLRSTIIREIHL